MFYTTGMGFKLYLVLVRIYHKSMFTARSQSWRIQMMLVRPHVYSYTQCPHDEFTLGPYELFQALGLKVILASLHSQLTLPRLSYVRRTTVQSAMR